VSTCQEDAAIDLGCCLHSVLLYDMYSASLRRCCYDQTLTSSLVDGRSRIETIRDIRKHGYNVHGGLFDESLLAVCLDTIKSLAEDLLSA
jgi:hypothetical protein